MCSLALFWRLSEYLCAHSLYTHSMIYFCEGLWRFCNDQVRPSLYRYHTSVFYTFWQSFRIYSNNRYWRQYWNEDFTFFLLLITRWRNYSLCSFFLLANTICYQKLTPSQVLPHLYPCIILSFKVYQGLPISRW